ncbi:MAG TPA: hypothetical protein VGV38_01490, partial [Pyrinomonadaceae bacterium]|nr:hypothetical protein [Pyrinomonadaceae bacterium]
TPAIAPARDFNKRANSLERNALPEGLFPGSSKKIYDALYLRTRGANPPRNRVRAARKDFTQWTDIKNLKTIDGHLRYLLTAGLIIRHWELGSTEGSEYEVRLPEELLRLPTTPHHSPPLPTTQFLGSGNTQFLGSGGYSQTVDSQATSRDHKTSFIKTDEKTDDDEAFAGFASVFRQAAKDVTGKELSASESQKLKELAEVLVTELKMAAVRTTVSSVPAFLAEHLRRRLWKKEPRQLEAEANEARQTTRQPPVDASQCPDCLGAGMWYPEGYEKGVAKCRHEKLAQTAGD